MLLTALRLDILTSAAFSSFGSSVCSFFFSFFFFQAEDGIRDPLVTGVQTCALPISEPDPITLFTPYNFICLLPQQRACQQFHLSVYAEPFQRVSPIKAARILFAVIKIGRASCRERV